MKHFNLIIGTLVVLISCSSGPTKEQIAQMKEQERIRLDNSEKLAELIISEIWNRKISDIIGPLSNSNLRHRGTRNTYWNLKQTDIVHGLEITKDAAFYKYLNRYNQCTGKQGNSFPISIQASVSRGPSKYVPDASAREKFRPVKNAYWLRLGLAFPYLKNCEFKEAVSTWALLSSMYIPVNIPMIDAHSFQKKLASKGMPLHFCHEMQGPYTGKFKHHKISCMMSPLKPSVGRGGSLLNPGPYRVTHGYQGNVRISTNPLNRNTTNFQYFVFNELRIEEEDLNKTFAEAFFKYFQNDEFLKKTEKHFQIAYEVYWRPIARERAKTAANAAKRRARKAREWRAHLKHENLDFLKWRQEKLNPTNNFERGDGASREFEKAKARINFAQTQTTSSSTTKFSEDAPRVPKKHPAQGWCESKGGNFNVRTGKCSQFSRYSSQTSSSKRGKTTSRSGNSFSKVDPKAPKVEEDKWYFDVALSDNSYGEAVEKAKEKAAKVCGRKNSTPVQVSDKNEKVVGFKYKARVDYKCQVR